MEPENKGNMNVNNSDLILLPDDNSAEVPTTPAPENVTSNIHLINIADRGFTNGVLGLAQEPFSDWLEADEQLKFAWSQLTGNQQKLFLTEQKLDKGIAAWKQYYQETTEEHNKLAEYEQKEIYLKNKISSQEAESEEKKSILNRLTSLYSWVPSVLLCLAGFVFIGADVGITHDIVINALNQPPGTESWLFAFALAFVAFVFKPAFDRILEKNYHDPVVRKRNHIFLVGVAAFALLTLTVMGFFRGQTDAERNQLKDLRNELTTIQDQADVNDDDSQTESLKATLTSKEAEIKQKQDNIIENGFRLWIFILSSILFAVSGTICLSIGMNSTEVLLKKAKLNKAISTLTRLTDSLLLELASVLSSKGISRNILEKLEKQIALDPELQQLREAINLIENNIAHDKRLILDYSIKKDSASYRDAYARGEKYSLDGNLTVKLSELEGKTNGNSSNNEGAGKRQKSKNGTSRRRRPFVMLRRIIADQFSKSGHPSNIDTEIEVADIA